MATRDERKQAKQKAREELKRHRAEQAAKTNGKDLALGCGCGLGIFLLIGTGISALVQQTGGLGSSGASATADAVASVAQCPPNAKPVDVAVDAETKLLAEPHADAKAIPWRVGAKTMPATLDASVAVRELCTSQGWSQVRVLGPQEMRELRGWVPASALRRVPVSGSGRRIYQASDFDWPDGSLPFKSAAVLLMNRIMDQRQDCDALDTRSLVMKGRGARAVFLIPCDTTDGLVSFDFTATDAINGRSFARVEPIGKLDAIEACKGAALSRATHPSSVSFPTFDYDYRDGSNGKAELRTKFSARNSFNLEVGFDLTCSFVGSKLEKVSISEATR